VGRPRDERDRRNGKQEPHFRRPEGWSPAGSSSREV
jgi:hypothetical protein